MCMHIWRLRYIVMTLFRPKSIYRHAYSCIYNYETITSLNFDLSHICFFFSFFKGIDLTIFSVYSSYSCPVNQTLAIFRILVPLLRRCVGFLLTGSTAFHATATIPFESRKHSSGNVSATSRNFWGRVRVSCPRALLCGRLGQKASNISQSGRKRPDYAVENGLERPIPAWERTKPDPHVHTAVVCYK